MKKTITLFSFCAVFFALCVPIKAQQGKIPRLGYLSNSDPISESISLDVTRRALRERGYIEGQNIAIVYRYRRAS